jgi:hypothetical protein
MTKRNIGREKSILNTLQLFGWVWILGALTATVYLFAQFMMSNIQENIYFYGILAGWTGAIWGVGLNESANFVKQSKSRRWLTTIQYQKTLRKWIIRSIGSLLYIFLFAFFTGYLNIN